MQNLTSPSELRARIDAHMAQNGLKPTRFGELATGDPNLIRNLDAGRELRSRTLARVLDFMATGKTYAEVRSEKGAA